MIYRRALPPLKPCFKSFRRFCPAQCVSFSTSVSHNTRQAASKSPNSRVSVDHLSTRLTALYESPVLQDVLEIMKSCARSGSPGTTKIAIEAYTLACTAFPKSTNSEMSKNVQNVLGAFKYCHSVHELAQLRHLWQSVVPEAAQLPINRVRYYASFIHVMLNTSQMPSALTLFHEIMKKNIDVPHPVRLRILPVQRLLTHLIVTKSCDDIIGVLQAALPWGVAVSLSDYLSLGLRQSHYKLVRFVYDREIVPEFDNVPAIGNKYNRASLLRILHVFAINGDIQRTLTFIEKYFIHENFRGKKAITKELSLNIIEAYSYHAASQSGRDESIMRILDIISGLNDKLKRDGHDLLAYKDITEPMSQRFLKYERTRISDEDQDPNQLAVENSHYSSENTLSNLLTLSDMIRIHLAYIELKGYSLDVTRIFMNTVLNHVNLHQNFSGLIRALLAFQGHSSKFGILFDKDTINIVFNSLANSNSAKQASLVLFNFLKSRRYRLNQDNYICLVSATLRGDFHKLLQYFLFQYRTDFPNDMDTGMCDLLKSIPSSALKTDRATEKAIEYVIKIQPGQDTDENLATYWEQHSICREEPIITDAKLTGFKREYNYTVDSRDADYLRFMSHDIALNS